MVKDDILKLCEDFYFGRANLERINWAFNHLNSQGIIGAYQSRQLDPSNYFQAFSNTVKQGDVHSCG